MTAPEARTLVFGATGAPGRHVLDALVARGISPGTITAVGRNQVRLGELASAGFGTAALDLSNSVGVADLVARHSDTPGATRCSTRLSPYVRHHIRVHGHYTFTLPDLGERN